MEPEKIKEIEAKITLFKKIEDTLPPEAKQVVLAEINKMVLALNKDVEGYLANMKDIEAKQNLQQKMGIK